MKISLNTRFRRFAIVTPAIALLGIYTVLATRQFVAYWLANRPQLASLKRAVALDPQNAEYHDRLGKFYEREMRDPVSAVKQYKAAVDLNPHSGHYWLDLAGAYRVLGDNVNQAAAIERALAADPTTSDVAWEAASLYAARGEHEKALREFGIVAATDAEMASAALENCWHLKPDVDALLRDVIPAHNSEAYLTFLSLLEAKQETTGTVKVWDLLMQTHQPFEVRYSYDYVGYLLRHHEVDQATAVWKQTASVFGLSSYLPSANNLVVNGNFNLPVLNAGFDWQYKKQQAVHLTVDPSESHGGGASLQIAFDGPGVEDAGIYELIAVQPDTTYNFLAFYKNDEMQGAGGPHITIQDMYTQAIYYESGELKDGEFWKSVSGEFTTAQDCKLVMLHIRRLPSGSPIRGKLWVADFRIFRKIS